MSQPRLDEAEIRRRYAHHAPDPDAVRRHERVRQVLADAAVALNEAVPEGRYKALMHTALEQARLWANTGVAVDSEPGQ